MNKIPVIIDCDPGHDDAIALLLAFSSDKLDVRAVTVVGGNQTLEKTANNALKVLSLIGIDPSIPVARGAAGPILKELEVAESIHGESGMDGPQLPEPTLRCVPEPAVVVMERVLRESAEPVTLIPCGPLTNIAALLLAHPELKPKIARISLMGGGAFYGNTTPAAEFNIWQDAEAASVVFSAGIPLTMHGICTTRMGYVEQKDIEAWRTLGRAGKFAAELMDFFTKFDREHGLPFSIHDANAVAWVIDPSLYRTERYNVQVDINGGVTRGCTVTDMRGHSPLERNVDVVMGVERERFVALLTDAFRRLG